MDMYSPEEYKALSPEEREAYQREGAELMRGFAETLKEHAEAIVEAAVAAKELSVTVQIAMFGSMLAAQADDMIESADRTDELLDERGIEGAEAFIEQHDREARQEAAQEGGGILGPGGQLL
jgi:sugar-specific transcriptional regulator TrmB